MKIAVPSCIPDATGAGHYRTSPVPYVPTIMDRLDAADRSWKILAAGPAPSLNIWAICPTFFECWGSSQQQNFVRSAGFTRYAAKDRQSSRS